jgi:hypothetical protein
MRIPTRRPYHSNCGQEEDGDWHLSPSISVCRNAAVPGHKSVIRGCGCSGLACSGKLAGNSFGPLPGESHSIANLDADTNVQVNLSVAGNEDGSCQIVRTKGSDTCYSTERNHADFAGASISKMISHVVQRASWIAEAKHEDPIIVLAACITNVNAASEAITFQKGDPPFRIGQACDCEVIAWSRQSKHVRDGSAGDPVDWKRD